MLHSAPAFCHPKPTCAMFDSDNELFIRWLRRWGLVRGTIARLAHLLTKHPLHFNESILTTRCCLRSSESTVAARFAPLPSLHCCDRIPRIQGGHSASLVPRCSRNMGMMRWHCSELEKWSSGAGGVGSCEFPKARRA